MQRPEKIYIKKFGIPNYSQLLGKVLVLLLVLLMTACASTTTATNKPPPPEISPSSGPIEQAAAPGSIEVKVTLVEFRIHSSVTVFHANTHYYFVVSNHGHDIHEFMIMPDKPDGSPLSPDEQYKGMLIELEPILPGSTWTTNFIFRTAGKYEIACQMGRHYQAGMRLPIAVNS
ncbi:MAG TPA: hypothetical protein VNW73_11360 [Ktedonobacteraceae bacterium]|nr:hypothetical protein [Ktedonobacteraceae bacterium]